MQPADAYNGYFFGAEAREILVKGQIAPADLPGTELLERVGQRLSAAAHSLGESQRSTRKAEAELLSLMERGVCLLGSPLLTNVAFYRDALASCMAVPCDERSSLAKTMDVATRCYEQNAGSGYNLDRHDDPVDVLLKLNEHARSVEAGRSCERYVGNMAHLTYAHPKIIEFIEAKAGGTPMPHFNISVDLDDQFFTALDGNGDVCCMEGTRIQARSIWDALTAAAWECGDPGIISLDRFNDGNSVAYDYPYVTTAPCAEVGLASGQACFFGYINLAACLEAQGDSYELNLELVARASRVLTWALDNALEASLHAYANSPSHRAVRQARKIGIGICGFADTLLWQGLEYGSQPSCAVLEAALSTMNYHSKAASAQLARERGCFPSFGRSKYVADELFLARQLDPMICEPKAKAQLSALIVTYGLRNSMTVALPPSGRTSLLMGVNTSLEPFLERPPLHRRTPVHLALGSLDNSSRRRGFAKATYKTATEVSFQEHLAIAKVAARLVDDGVSKTVNLPSGSTRGDVSELYRTAWSWGLKAISVYRPRVSTKICPSHSPPLLEGDFSQPQCYN